MSAVSGILPEMIPPFQGLIQIANRDEGLHPSLLINSLSGLVEFWPLTIYLLFLMGRRASPFAIDQQPFRPCGIWPLTT
jgi:hypothetical protein